MTIGTILELNRLIMCDGRQNMATNTEKVEKKSLTWFFPHAARLLMGLAFVFFGLIGFFQLMKTLHNLPEDIKMVNAALIKAGYMNVVSGTMTIVGLLLFISRFVPLGLALIVPILIGILTFRLRVDLTNIAPGAILPLLKIYLVWTYRAAFYPMLSAKVSPASHKVLAQSR